MCVTMNDVAMMWVCLGVVGGSYASLTYFGDLLRRTAPKFGTHVRIDTLTLKQKFDPPHPRGVIYCLKSFATNVIILTRDESPLVYRALVVSEDSNFDLSTALFHVTMYRQFARKVGTSANSALIRYYLPRLKLSSSTRVSEGTNA